MKKLIVIGATALAALFLALGYAPSAQAYPQTSCKVDLNAQKVLSGSKLHVTAEAQTVVTDDGLGKVAAVPNKWHAEFNNETRDVTADVLDITFDVPEVTERTTFQLVVQSIMPGVTAACGQTLDIVVEPGSTSVAPPGHLPNTGGPHLSLLIGGFGLVAAGGVAIRQSRRTRTLGSHAA